jgi:hypothetical protein
VYVLVVRRLTCHGLGQTRCFGLLEQADWSF